jgi:hypothetical protein
MAGRVSYFGYTQHYANLILNTFFLLDRHTFQQHYLTRNAKTKFYFKKNLLHQIVNENIKLSAAAAFFFEILAAQPTLTSPRNKVGGQNLCGERWAFISLPFLVAGDLWIKCGGRSWRVNVVARAVVGYPIPPTHDCLTTP